VSTALDGQINPKFAEAKMVDAVQSIADLSASTPVLLDTLISDGGVPYDPLTGVFSLDANSTYELEAQLKFENYGTPATDVARWRWIDSLGNTLPPGHRVEGYAVPATSSLDVSLLTSAKTVFRTTEAIGAQIVATNGTGSADVSLSSWAIVRKIG
jgi:hypothetical protein